MAKKKMGSMKPGKGSAPKASMPKGKPGGKGGGKGAMKGKGGGGPGGQAC